MSKESAFHERRRKGIGGSDIGAILGLDQYRDALDVWQEKVNGATTEPNEAMLRGKYLEIVVSQLYLEESGRKLSMGKFRRHRQHTLMQGHPDRIIVATKQFPVGRECAGVLECKTANRWAMRKFKDKGVPDSYVLQLQHYLAITGTTWGAIAILCPDPWEFITFEMDFDADLYESIALRCETWWGEHITKKVPPIPAPIVFDDAPPPEEGEAVQDLSERDGWAALVATFLDIRDTRKHSADSEKLVKAEMQDFVGGESGIYEGAGVRMYLREQSGRKSLDQRSLDAYGAVDPLTMATLLQEAGLDLDDIEILLDAANLDLSRFTKQGKSFTTMKVYEQSKETTT